jgi:hypothetical protein
MRQSRTFGYPNEVRQFDSFSSSSDPFVTGRSIVRALTPRAHRQGSDFEPCISHPSPRRSDISGNPSGWFSGASDRSGPVASQDATACIAISSKMNDMRANRRALRGLARMLHGNLQKKLFAKEATARE